VQVNGGAWQNITFDPTGSWTTWTVKDVAVTLNSGTNNAVRLESTGQDLANIDELSVITGGSTPTPTRAATPTPTSGSTLVYKFDFGGGSVQSGYTKVSATLAYSSSRGYGFNTPSNMVNVSSSGTGINTDAVQFKVIGTTSTNTFNCDLPVGLYQIKVILGNCVRSSVAAEGVYQIMNMTGNNAVDSIQIPITDGQLNLIVTDGKVGEAHTLSALEITQLSTNPAMNKTIWIGGDSTVCNYYPLSNTDNSVQTGWGQMLPSYISSSRYQIRNMATGGQIARGFLNDGQFTAIMKYLKAGDIFILQFGINDVASKNSTTSEQFTQYMGTMVSQAKATGATVVLNTPQGRASNWSGTTHTCLDASYRPQTVALAQSTNTPLVDLCVLSSAYYTSIGQTATYALYMSDYLHLNRVGALQLARIEYEELTRQNLLK
jgi:lysophospholipase L1-like esterase/fibronectin type 3 domain-containing protein